MAFKFTSSECNTAASSLNNSASKIGELLDEFGNLISSVAENYHSETSNQIVDAFNNIKSIGPEFQQAISDCAKYLTDTVAPAYEKLETTAQSKVEGL